jgi:FKBP-type peptidyl-prolyl cis-trans isomerase 2
MYIHIFRLIFCDIIAHWPGWIFVAKTFKISIILPGHSSRGVLFSIRMELSRMTVKKGDKIKVDYEGFFDDGTIFDSSTHGDHSHPLEFVVGSGNVIPGFDNAVVGMEIDQEKTVKIPAADAYGEKNPDMMMKVPRSKIPAEAKEGMSLMASTPDGQEMPIVIAKIEGEEVTLDMNHPLAGKTLNFKLKLKSIN